MKIQETRDAENHEKLQKQGHLGPPPHGRTYQNGNAILARSGHVNNSTLVPAPLLLVRGFRGSGSLLAGNLNAAGCTLRSFDPGLQAK